MKNNYSIIREAEYSQLKKLSLNGDILDIGGSKKSGYQELIGGIHTFKTVNLDESYGCDFVFDIQEIFPIESESIDHVLCLNVLEHIYGFHNVFSESARVIKKGGSFIIATPFFHQIHGSPDDFYRYTDSALRKLLEDNSFEVKSIEPLGYGLFSLVFQMIGGAVKNERFRIFIKRVALITDKFLSRSSRYKNLIGKIPLGYFTIAIKI